MMSREKARDSISYILGFKSVQTTRQRVLVIVSHIFLWGLFLATPLLIYRIRILDITFFYRELVNKSFLVILFYLNYFYLLPRFFQRGRIAHYFMRVTGVLILLCGLQFTVEYFFRQHLHKTRGMMLAGNRAFKERVLHDSTGAILYIREDVTAPGLHGREGRRGQVLMHTAKDSLIGVEYAEPSAGPFPMGGPFRERGMFLGFFSMVLMNMLSSGVIILLLGGFIKLANSLWVSEKQKKALETERLNAELNFLKLQINPHFLFNTLNSIYSQAHLKSEQTEYSILKFSQIMRYVLYDSTTEKIPLSRDIEYIRNYIDLQKLRLSKNVTIQYEVSGISEDLLIPPLLLITFIENAFKHGISYTSPSAINIKIAAIGNELLLTVGNTIVKKREDPGEKSDGGVGLTNARRRLDVLYPGRYELDISDNKSIYVVNLKIVLNHETELHHH